MDKQEKRRYTYRKLSELSLIDDFLFGLYIQEATAEEIKELIECLLGMKIAEINLSEKQHTILNDPEKHSVRLDAFVKDTDGNIYNIEVQASDIKHLEKRMRYNQSLIDRENMESGTFQYDKLPNTIIIFIVDRDVFGKGLYKYTFKNTCLEDNTVLFKDETVKVVLNTKGTRRVNVSDELVEFLKYFSNSTDEYANNAKSDYVKRVNRKLKPIKNNPEFGGAYMSLQEKLYNERESGRTEGLITGTVRTYLEVGKSPEEIIANIIEKFTLSREDAEKYVNECRS